MRNYSNLSCIQVLCRVIINNILTTVVDIFLRIDLMGEKKLYICNYFEKSLLGSMVFYILKLEKCHAFSLCCTKGSRIIVNKFQEPIFKNYSYV